MDLPVIRHCLAAKCDARFSIGTIKSWRSNSPALNSNDRLLSADANAALFYHCRRRQYKLKVRLVRAKCLCLEGSKTGKITSVQTIKSTAGTLGLPVRADMTETQRGGKEIRSLAWLDCKESKLWIKLQSWVRWTNTKKWSPKSRNWDWLASWAQQ